MKIVTVVGARPQFIKAAVVSRAIRQFNATAPASPHLTPHTSHLTEVIVHTGQHYDEGMSAIFFRELDIPEPDYNLAVGSGSHGRQTGRMLMRMEEVFERETPDWVLLYGDTNSTLAGALAAAKMHIRIAHVEAGLRSFNKAMPEEINRVVTDHLSELLFCPGAVARDNLAEEGITEGVCIVGDVMAEAVQYAASGNGGTSDIIKRLNVKNGEYLLATVHRAENTDDRKRLGSILDAFGRMKERVVFPVHPRTRKIMGEMNYEPAGNVQLIDPVGYMDMIALERQARMILTDSGGMQKEAYWLGIPCVTLRDETEWVETVESGWNRLAGADADAILEAVKDFVKPAGRERLYGEGKASGAIVERLCGSEIRSQ